MERFGKQSEKYKEAQGLSKEALSRILSHEGKIYAYAADDALAGLLGVRDDNRVMLYNRMVKVFEQVGETILLPASKKKFPSPEEPHEAKVVSSIKRSFPELKLEKAEKRGRFPYNWWFILRKNPQGTVVSIGIHTHKASPAWQLEARTLTPSYTMVREWINLERYPTNKVIVNTDIVLYKADGINIRVNVFGTNTKDPELQILKTDEQYKDLLYARSNFYSSSGYTRPFLSSNGGFPLTRKQALEWLDGIEKEVKSGLDILRDNAHF